MSAASDSNRRVSKGSRGDIDSARVGPPPEAPLADQTSAASVTATIRGQVACERGPFGEATVALSGGPAHRDLAALTDSQGSFVLAGLLPGTYEISVHAPGHSPQTKSAQVGAAQTAVVNFQLGE